MTKKDIKNQLNCCKKPNLETIKAIYESNHDLETLQKCKNCGSYWFYRYHEYKDDWTVWYSLLTQVEGKKILDAKDKPDLSFLNDKLSIMEDSEGVKQVKGQPTHPWS